MTLSTQSAASQIATIWQSAQSEQAFWAGVAGLVSAQRYEKGDVITLLDAVRASCTNVFGGPYTLPPVPGGLASGAPVAMFTSWSCWLLAQVGVPNSFAAGLQALASLDAQPAGGLRRDAATDMARLVAAWFWKVPIFQSPIPVVSSDTQTMSLVSNAVNIAGAGAVNMPKVGPYLGSAVQLVAALLQAFFPGPTPPSPVSIADGLFEQDEIAQAARGLIADGNWFCSLYNVLSGAGYVQVSLTADWQQQNILTPANQRLAGLTPTDGNLLTLVDNVDVPGVIELLVYGASVYVALCKQVVTTDMALASVSQANGDTDGSLQQIAQALDDFTRYQEAVLGDPSITPSTPNASQSSTANWGAQINALLLQVAAARLSQITYSFSVSVSQTVGEVFVNGSIDDKGTPQGTTTKTLNEDIWPLTIPPVPGNLTGFLQHIWGPYVQSVASALDALYANHFACVAGWLYDVEQWQEQLPVLPPAWTPTFGADPWTAGAPNGAVWVAGTQLRYAVIAANQVTTSPPGPWTDPPLAVSSGSCPVMQLQPDTTGTIALYQICRQVRPPGASGFGSTVIVGIAQPTDATYTDTDCVDVGMAPVAAPQPRPVAPAERLPADAGA